ncbi:hypothetical protein GF314_05565 [bacterium]|nr:hypothetical protein [bacterium]
MFRDEALVPPPCLAIRESTPMRSFLGLVLLTMAATTLAGPPLQPRPGEVPEGPHPWRQWEAERRIAALERQAADRAVGDPDPVQLLFDVTHYDLDLDVDVAGETLDGTVETTAIVVDEATDTLVLDLTSLLTTDAVRVDAAPVTFTHADDRLTIDLDRLYEPGETVTVAVDYHGDPSGAGNAFGWSWADGRKLVWSLSEPYGARTWWPCKDLNVDKADSVDVRVTIDEPYVVASNGVLAAENRDGGRATYHWRSRYPIATYLVSITAYPYSVFTDTYTALDGTTMPVENHVVPDYEEEAREGYGRVPEMITVFRGAFGEYPFLAEKYGHAHFTWGGGMEHQTCSSMIYYFHGEGLIAHELAHQWWGDLVTCADFHHIWLNEGFATWSEAYWREQTEGFAAYREEMLENEYLGGGTIYVEDPDDFGSIFDLDLSYDKASWVVHMLRGVLGDEDFFAGLALYRERFAYGTATTEDLQAAMEDVSGRDLATFFQQWIYGSGHPEYLFGYEVASGPERSTIHVRIEQTQDEPVFEMPIRLRLHHALGFEEVVVENDRRVQHYVLTGPPGVGICQFDPQDWILCNAYLDQLTATPPASPALTLAARPNPFNPRTTLHLSSPTAGHARLVLYDARGRLVRSLLDREIPAGERTVGWDGRNRAGREAAAGVYLAVLEIAGERRTARLALVR